MTATDRVHAPAVETPSGKDADYENFPVGSFLLPKSARPHVAVFYRYARAIDDIADNAGLAADEKIRRLDGFASALRGEGGDETGYETGLNMRESLLATNIPLDHCLKLIDAFQQDAVKSRYESWEELIHYCDRSAAPVGRYLIDLTGGASDGYASSDALCNALQVINHIQDLKDDYQSLNRVYLPEIWMREAGASVEMLGASQESAELRVVIARCLAGCRRLMRDARGLPAAVRSRRLAMEAAAIIRIADLLIEKLGRMDPIAGRVKLSKAEYAGCIARGALAGLFV